MLVVLFRLREVLKSDCRYTGHTRYEIMIEIVLEGNHNVSLVCIYDVYLDITSEKSKVQQTSIPTLKTFMLACKTLNFCDVRIFVVSKRCRRVVEGQKSHDAFSISCYGGCDDHC